MKCDDTRSRINKDLETPSDYLREYPHVCAHVICESLGYASPTKAAMIMMHGHRGEPDYCEWIDACYSGDARRALEDAIRHRHGHKGYMAEFKLAYALVQRANETGQEPELASWF